MNVCLAPLPRRQTHATPRKNLGLGIKSREGKLAALENFFLFSPLLLTDFPRIFSKPALAASQPSMFFHILAPLFFRVKKFSFKNSKNSFLTSENFVGHFLKENFLS